MINVGFIGAGNMGAALAKAAKASGIAEIYISDKDNAKAKALAKAVGGTVMKNRKIAESCDYVFLAVKPNIIPEVAAEIGVCVYGTIVSMAAGVKIESIEDALGRHDIPIIRIMPNTPAAVGSGMILWCKNEIATADTAKGFAAVLEQAGRLDEIPEKLIDAGSAVSGCGPAFVYMFIEALADGGVRCGLSREKALLYAAETVKGSAMMVLAGEGHPDELKDRVCSPGGSTIEGVIALEEGAFRAKTANAVTKAYQKTLELGK